MVDLPSKGPSVLLYAHLPQGEFVKSNLKKIINLNESRQFSSPMKSDNTVPLKQLMS